MIHVGLDFEIVRWRLPRYISDFIVAICLFLAPMALTFLYLSWSEGAMDFNLGLHASMFTGPTGAGMLISLMQAADLKGTWVFKKAIVLAIWGQIVVVVFSLVLFFAFAKLLFLIPMVGLLAFAWCRVHRFVIPHTWPWVLLYAFVIGTACGWSLELRWVAIVLIPSFTLGVVIHNPSMNTSQSYKHIEIELSEELIERQEYIQSYAPCIETFMGCTVMFAV